MQDSSSSFQLTESSGTGSVGGMPGRIEGETASAASRGSSSGSSRSKVKQLHKVTQRTGRPPPSVRRQVHPMEEAASASPSGSSLPPLEDRTQAQMIEDSEELPPLEREGDGSGVQFSQTFNNQRAFHDQRSIHIHNPEASLIGRMAETAASAMVSEAKAEATQVVSGIMTQAEHSS